jgi:hypothetical protein
MLNPSTADHTIDDPTIRRVSRFTARFGGTELVVINVFAWRATNPTELAKADDPVGPWNDHAWAMLKDESALVVAAWGASAPPALAGPVRAAHAALVERGALCLGLTQVGHPRHPLYLPADTALVPLPRYGGP